MRRKMKQVNIILFFLFIFYMIDSEGYLQSEAEEVSPCISGKILCIKSVDGTDTLYVGAEDGLYRTLNAGGNWEKMDLPGDVFDVTDIAVTDRDIFIATGSGVYASGDGTLWEWLPGTRRITGVDACCGKVSGGTVIAWSPEKLFLITDISRELTGPGFKIGPIGDAACRNGIVFVASGADVYRLPAGGKVWEKITLLIGCDMEEIAGTNEIEEADREVLTTGNIDPYGPEGAAVATAEGVFIITDEGRVKRKINTTGLPRARLRYVAYAGEDLFAATDRRVFVRSDDGECWRLFFEKTFPGVISFLEGHVDSRGRKWLWMAGGRYLYKQSIGSFAHAGEEKGKEKDPEPTIREVHRMAVEYAEVSPEKISGWRRGARWKALMPRLSLNFSESIDDNIEIYKSASTSYIVAGPRERNDDWGVDLTWDLSDLVWNPNHT